MVVAICGVATALVAADFVRDSSTGPWPETALLIGVAIVSVAIGWTVAAQAFIDLSRAAAGFFAPVQPSGLNRISRVIEQVRAEQEAAAAGHPREPLPEIVAALRAISGSGGG